MPDLFLNGGINVAKHKHQPTMNVVPKQDSQVLTPEFGNARIISGVLDWIIGGVFSGLPAVLFWAILGHSSKPMTSMYLFESSGFSRTTTVSVALLCLLFGFVYYVVIPWRVWPGQTLGKHWMHIQIVRRDHKPLTLSTLVVRNFIFLVLIEGIATATSTYLKVIITTLSRFYVDSYMTIIWSVITIVSMIFVFFGSKHLALHDLAVDTVVVRQPVLKEEVSI